MKNIRLFLVGLPGVGKTTYGKDFAAQHHLKFIDLDVEIEKILLLSVSEIFAQHGESYFREQETLMLNKIIHEEPTDFLLATGGGTPCHNDNIYLINRHGISIYLDFDLEVIKNNLKDKNNRPLLKHVSVEELDTIRRPFYQQSKVAFHDYKNFLCANLSDLIST